MPRKLGPRHASSRRALATVNRLASAANDIRRLAWHDHRTLSGEDAIVSAFATAQAIDRRVAQHLSTLWRFTRYLAQNWRVDDEELKPAKAAVKALYKLNTKTYGEVITEREAKALLKALNDVDELPAGELARAISHILARVARLRCNRNANASYQRRVDRRGTVWSEGALWSPPRKKAAGETAARPRVQAKPAPPAPELKVLPGEGRPAEDEGAPIDVERLPAVFDGLRGLRRSIFSR